MFNVYGPTECTVTAAVGRLTPGRPVTLGGPLADLRARVADPELLPQPPSVPGELCVAGPGGARGYLGRPATTAERFVPDPWSSAPGGRLYRTGDRARWLPDGRLEALGRLDRQVKVRGVRIEPGEVEAALSRLSGIREAVVDAVRDAAGDVELAAWVTAREGVAANAGALRRELETVLPPYLVPTRFHLLSDLPRTPTGKIDRRRLRERAAPAEPRARSSAPPATPAERWLAELFGELLGVDGVGRDDDFFDLGGHSLTSVRLATRIRGATGIELPLRRVFELRTVARLAAELPGDAVRDAAHATAPAEAPRRDPAAPAGPFPLSHAQERLWLLSRLEPEAATYTVAGGVRLRGRLQPAALAEALAEVARRHQVLRATFGDSAAKQR